MKKITILTGIAITLFCFTATSHATLLQATITANVTSISGALANSIWTVGDSFGLKVIYNDAGNVMHEWYDGVNGIAEQGSVDDSVKSTYNIGDFADYTFFDDAQFFFDAKTQLFKSASTDVTDDNITWAYYYNPFFYTVYDFRADGFEVYVDDYLFPNGFVYSFEGNTYISLTDMQIDTRAAVPEPTTMLLLGTGLVGMAGAARRRKKNQA